MNEHHMTAREIAQSREPDSITYGPWEADPDSKRTRKFSRVVGGSMLHGFDYEHTEVDEYTRERRQVFSYWNVPAFNEPVFKPLAVTMLGEDIGAMEVIYHPKKTVGSWKWEYRNVGD